MKNTIISLQTLFEAVAMAEKTTTQFWIITISFGRCMEGGKISAYGKQQLWNAFGGEKYFKE